MPYFYEFCQLEPKQGQKFTEYSIPNLSALSHAIAERVQINSSAHLVIAKNDQDAKRIYSEIKWHLGEEQVLHFPNWEVLPYDHYSPHQDIAAARLEALYQVSKQNNIIIVVSADTLCQKVAPIEFVQNHCLVLNKNEKIDINQFKKSLLNAGYRMVEQVLDHGEACFRGDIIDLFPTGCRVPIRIELFDNEIDNLRGFDTQTQRSHEQYESVKILPAKEYPRNSHSIELFTKSWQEHFPHCMDSDLLKKVQSSVSIPGIEHYQPLFFTSMLNLIDYLPTTTTIIHPHDLNACIDEFSRRVKDRFEQQQGDRQRPLLNIFSLYETSSSIMQKIKRYKAIKLFSADGPDANALPLLDISKSRTYQKTIEKIPDKKILSFFSRSQLQQCKTYYDSHRIDHAITKTWEDCISANIAICLAQTPIRQGYHLPSAGITVLCEHDFAVQTASHSPPDVAAPSPSTAVLDPSTHLANLNVGDAIVHVEHGVGRYRGLCHKQLGTISGEFIRIDYADQNQLFVPIHQIGMLHPYSIADIEHPPLHKLGNKKWQQQKQKAQQKVFDIASELLESKAMQALSVCSSFDVSSQNFIDFCSAFRYELTEDQDKAVKHIQSDLLATHPMNRLICGDVGFGKTEVAMRAAFITVDNKKQVAILAPTTLLAEQHDQTFKERFADWPINIACLTRFRTAKEQETLLKKLAEGQIDIIIGTHSLLQKRVGYRDLGLLIIDEEHRFGVRQKNTLKSLYSDTHTLSLTATPIPRTLQQTFNELNDLSIISTPPKKRLSVTTIYTNYSRVVIKEAIERELMRGGQVYFLHNKVSSMPSMLESLKKIAPHQKIGVAHGQMPEKTLESVMHQFSQQKYDVLLCSTIIESGIDIPNANTIIINKADQLGLAQLHQLRGRVGRSHHQAFAYLLVDEHKKLSRDAEMRLEAISQTDSLGGGYLLATHDLEIRGAGDLLGKEQSGHLECMGFSLYHELLEKTVAALKENPKLSAPPSFDHACVVELSESALFPESYITDAHSRLLLYKRVALADTLQKLNIIQDELIDRFGRMPKQAQLYCKSHALKIVASNQKIRKIKIYSSQGIIDFGEKASFNFSSLLNIIHEEPKVFRMQEANTLRFTNSLLSNDEQIDFIIKLLNNIQ